VNAARTEHITALWRGVAPNLSLKRTARRRRKLRAVRSRPLSLVR